jgi:hypothetical protein
MVRSDTVDLICAEFSRLVDDEIRQARPLKETNDVQSLKRLCRWSYAFHPLLLREFAMADAAVREGGPGFWYTEMRELPDYYLPTSARPAWTAWGAFIELTIRRLAQRVDLRGEVLPAIANRPVVILKRSGTRPGHALEICHSGMGKRKGAALPPGTVLSSMLWEIPASSCPWQFPQRKGGASPARPISRGSLKRMRAPEASAVYDIYQNKPVPAAFQTWLSSL